MRQALQLSGAELRELAQHFRKDAEDALAGKPSSLSALRTYLGLPTGREMGTFLALDFGGTNVRASRIRLMGEQGFVVESKVAKPLKCADYDYTSSSTTAEELFDFIAAIVKEAAEGNQDYKLGFTFPLPSIRRRPKTPASSPGPRKSPFPASLASPSTAC